MHEEDLPKVLYFKNNSFSNALLALVELKRQFQVRFHFRGGRTVPTAVQYSAEYIMLNVCFVAETAPKRKPQYSSVTQVRAGRAGVAISNLQCHAGVDRCLVYTSTVGGMKVQSRADQGTVGRSVRTGVNPILLQPCASWKGDPWTLQRTVLILNLNSQ